MGATLITVAAIAWILTGSKTSEESIMSFTRSTATAPFAQITKVGWSPDLVAVDINPLVQKNVRLQGSFSHNFPVWERVVHLLERARTASARSVNAIMTSTYWEIGRRIVEYEQKGERRAAYGQALLARLAADLAGRFGRGFSERNLGKMRLFYLSWKIPPTLTAKSAGVSTEQ